ncbi:MAG: S8 family serine peptidase [Acidimicrobiia bacterium]|nr:S8 family serine peptidase [Acidimicrobiia bacterium]
MPPQVTPCSAPVTTDDGKTQYFAVVDDGSGPQEAVTFDAATPAEQKADVAKIEATQGDVVAVEVDQVANAAVNTDEPLYAGTAPFTSSQAQWGIDQATFPVAWGNGTAEGAGVKVAVIDTGVQGTHPDLAGAVVPGTDFVAGGDGTNDQNGHGTHVAGILGARDQEPTDTGGIGGAPMVTILPVRVLDASGSGSYSAVINGINYAVAQGADVISMSLCGTGSSSSLQTAVSNAIAAGVVVVAAAGNNGTCNTLYPAVLPGVIAVGATVQSPADTLASFSQHGSDVDIAAPGSIIWSDIPTSSYGQKSGTSMATPFVSAAAALLVKKCKATPSWGLNTPAKVEQHLESTAAAIPSGNTIQSGSGALRAGAATAAVC